MTEQDNEKLDLLLKKLERVESRTDSIYQGFYGIPGTEEKGLCGALKELLLDHNKLKRNFWILISFLVGSGVLGTSIWALIT